MSIVIAIVGESWETFFSQATLESLASWIPDDAKVILPSGMRRFVNTKNYPFPLLFFEGGKAGFQSCDDLRKDILAQRNGDRHGLLLLFAGAMPAQPAPLVKLQRYFCEKRVVEWFPPDESLSGPTELCFLRPPHLPPPESKHKIERNGTLDCWTVQTGRNYFPALLSANNRTSNPVWSSYGPRRPVFVYNTNEFEETPVPPHDDYFILASGLLGLRMVTESSPPANARVVVYDINPDQLDWIRFALKMAGEIPKYNELIERFSSLSPQISIRWPLEHELENAERQSRWYAENRLRLAEWAEKLDWEFVRCDLWTDPGVLMRKLIPERKLFFMYLDLFVVWHVGNDYSWVESYEELASSLESVVLQKAGANVTFLPGPNSKVFQLHPRSPFA